LQKLGIFPQVSIVNEAPGASFTKLICGYDKSFGNFSDMKCTKFCEVVPHSQSSFAVLTLVLETFLV
jgi:hypothetical protein